ncbi:MAG: TIGR00375 family protein [Euryarchaeota archaeon]|nr:TIGR00375 family protein [Euryarchaeota archaeon]
MEVNADLHIHSRFSGATSRNMRIETIAEQAPLKGLQLVGTGDALHPDWLKEVLALEEVEEGIFRRGETSFILTCEVEDTRKVHHLIILPSPSAAEELRERFSRYSLDLKRDGRPHLTLRGEEIAEIANEVDALVGPSHAFVPWTSIYKEYDSLRECYGSARIAFLELGLSADSDLADTIAELQSVTFLSNSDAHSPWPNKLGREFNRLRLRSLSFTELKRALLRQKGNRVVLNVGFDPRLGKYHRTACIRCYTHFELEEAEELKWRCRCGGRIKKGVRDRIREIATWDEPRHPEHRPPYLRIAPLSEIIAQALRVSGVYSSRVQGMWRELVTAFGSEIRVLVDVEIEEIAKVGGEAIAELIRRFRAQDFEIREGGGGKYGEIIFNRQKKEVKRSQLSLDNW